jgi:hypothetical protein
VNPEKVKIQGRVCNGKFALKNLINALFDFKVHTDGLGGGMVIVQQFAGHAGGLNCGRNMDMQGAFLIRDQGSEGGFKLGLLAVVENSHGSLLRLILDKEDYTLFFQKKKGIQKQFLKIRNSPKMFHKNRHNREEKVRKMGKFRESFRRTPCCLHMVT